MLSEKEIIDSYIDDMINLHLRMIPAENEEIYIVQKTLAEIYCKIEDIVNARDDLQELCNLFRLYDDTRNTEEMINYRNLYTDGIKDGIKILKALGVLEKNNKELPV